MEKALISVILPVYNAEKHLREAIDSILSQSYSHFELFIINDGSTDSTEQIIQSYTDPRIKCIKNEKNLGLIATLNKGIELSTGEFIARMDADDISLPQRFEKQIAFMQKNPDVGAAGSWYYNFSKKGRSEHTLSSNSAELQSILLFNSCLCHPSVIIRKSVLTTNNIKYHSACKHAEDYDLWIEISKVCKLSNVPEFLFKYRTHEEQVTNQHNSIQKESAAIIRKNYLAYCGFVFSENEFVSHQLIANNSLITKKEQLAGIEKWLHSLIIQNNKFKKIDCKSFNAFIGKMWFDSCGMTNLGLYAYGCYFKPDLAGFYPLNLKGRIKLFTKCIIRKFRKS